MPKLNLNLSHPILDENGEELEINGYADLAKALDLANAEVALQEAGLRDVAQALAFARAFKTELGGKGLPEAEEEYELSRASLRDAHADRALVLEAFRSAERHFISLTRDIVPAKAI